MPLRRIVAPYDRWRVQQIDRARRGLAAASALIGDEMTRWLGRVLGDLADDLQRLPGPAIVHGDLWHENMLVRGSRLTAVLDWEAARRRSDSGCCFALQGAVSSSSARCG